MSGPQAHRDVRLTVNGRARDLTVDVREALADTLRDRLGLTGTNLGCEHGVCGTCTVLLDGRAVRSCLVLTAGSDGADVRTVEGLAHDPRGRALQEAFHSEHALQCGFCTPGFLMLVAGALDERPGLADDPDALDAVLASNLCRCTGYITVRRAVMRAARELRG